MKLIFSLITAICGLAFVLTSPVLLGIGGEGNADNRLPQADGPIYSRDKGTSYKLFQVYRT